MQQINPGNSQLPVILKESAQLALQIFPPLPQEFPSTGKLLFLNYLFLII